LDFAVVDMRLKKIYFTIAKTRFATHIESKSVPFWA
jgi:hypothetical protein